jgi:hypothetical protein
MFYNIVAIDFEQVRSVSCDAKHTECEIMFYKSSKMIT